MNDTDKLLAERGSTHGEYSDHARVTQTILRACMTGVRYDALPDEIKETLHMIAHKVGRIVTGDPFHQDHYDDIMGYSRLVVQRLDRLRTTSAESVREATERYTDLYAELAAKWGVSRPEAKKHAYRVLFAIPEPGETPAELLEKFFDTTDSIRRLHETVKAAAAVRAGDLSPAQAAMATDEAQARTERLHDAAAGEYEVPEERAYRPGDHVYVTGDPRLGRVSHWVADHTQGGSSYMVVYTGPRYAAEPGGRGRSKIVDSQLAVVAHTSQLTPARMTRLMKEPSEGMTTSYLGEKPVDLVVTIGGERLENQELGIELFRAAASGNQKGVDAALEKLAGITSVDKA